MGDSNGGSDFGLAAILASFGYFVYGGLHGAFGMVIFNFIVGLATIILSLIPGIGFIVAYFVGKAWVIPAVFAYTGIFATTLTTIVFGFYLILGFIISISMVALILGKN